MLDRLKIKAKLGLPLALSVAALVAAIFSSAELMHRRMMADRLEKLRAIIEVAAGVAQSLENEVVAGKMTREQAIERFGGYIPNMWYDNHQDYLLIATMDGVMLGNGGNPRTNGTRGTNAGDWSPARSSRWRHRRRRRPTTSARRSPRSRPRRRARSRPSV